MIDYDSMVQKRLDDLMARADALGLPVPRPTVSYDLRGTVAGRARWNKYRGAANIQINRILLLENLDDAVHNLVGHEFAHIVVGYHWPKAKAHGYEWQGVMRRLGMDPMTTHKYDVERSRVWRVQQMDMYCGCGVHTLSVNIYNKIVLKGKKYKCRKCNQLITKEPRI